MHRRRCRARSLACQARTADFVGDMHVMRLNLECKQRNTDYTFQIFYYLTTRSTTIDGISLVGEELMLF